VSTISETSNLLPSSHAFYHIFRWLRIQMAYIDLDQKIQRQLIQCSRAALESIRLNAINSRGDPAQRYQTAAVPDMAHQLYNASTLRLRVETEVTSQSLQLLQTKQRRGRALPPIISPYQRSIAVADAQVRSQRGLYTEHVSITCGKRGNRSKSGARNHLYRTRLHYTRDRQ
jgi:hypothetical protein